MEAPGTCGITSRLVRLLGSALLLCACTAAHAERGGAWAHGVVETHAGTTTRVSYPEPGLDWRGLQARLAESEALGMLDRLWLKGEARGLLGALREHHASTGATSLAILRRRFDHLVDEVLAWLHRGDPALAAVVARAREPLWATLADPVRLARM